MVNLVAAPFCGIQLIYNAGDVKGSQTVSFNFPNDKKTINEVGIAMVMLKNVAEAKLRSIAGTCISEEQNQYVDSESMFTHMVFKEHCHGIKLSNNKQSLENRTKG